MNNQNKYKHLEEKDREIISRMLGSGRTQREIAEVLGVHFSTVSREIKRNSSSIKGYMSV